MTSIASALGIGSGIDTAKLVSDLAAAARAPREAAIKAREDANKAQVSSLSSLRAALDAFSNSLATLASGGSLATQAVISDTSIVSATVARGAALDAFSGQLEVRRLATAQSLVSVAIADAGAPIGQGALNLTVGGANYAIAIGAGNDSLSGLAGAINASGSGVRATIVREGGQARLVLRGPSGVVNGFTLALSSGAAGLAQFTWNGTTGGMSLAQAAGDAQLNLDGVTITRPTNRIDDVFTGIVLDLKKAAPGAPVTLSSERPTAALKQSVYDFAQAYNQLESMLDDATASGVDAAAAGALRGSAAVRDMRAQLARIVSAGLADGDGPRTLGEIGVSTGRDGALAIDGRALDAAIAANPAAVERLFNPAIRADNGLVRVTSVAGAVKPGQYALANLVPAAAGATASGTIDGVDAIANGSILSARAGSAAAGLSFEVLGAVAGATVTVDRGIASAFKAIRDALNTDSGPIGLALARFATDAKTLSAERATMEARADANEARLKATFGAMETRVAALKATQTYLQQQFDAWSNRDR